MDIKSFFNDLGATLNTTLTPDDKNSVDLHLDDVLVHLQFNSVDNSIMASTVVAYREHGFNYAQLERALEINLFGYESMSFHLGYFKALKALILSGSIKEDEFDATSVAGYLGVLADISLNIEKQIDSLDEADAKDSENDSLSLNGREPFMLDV